MIDSTSAPRHEETSMFTKEKYVSTVVTFGLAYVHWGVTQCNDLNCVPQKGESKSWPPEPVNMTLFVGSLCRCNQVSWSHTALGWALNPNSSNLKRKDMKTQRYTGKKTGWRWSQRWENCSSKLRNAKDCQQPPEARKGKEGFCSTDFWGSVTLLTHWFRTSNFQNCEWINLSSFRPPSLW